MIPETLQLWLFMAVLITAVLLFMLMPLIRSRQDAAGARAGREVYDINVYKDQLKEVERDLERGVILPEMAEAARTEIKRRMLTADAAAPETVAGPETKSSMLMITLLAVAVPIGAMLMYLSIGSPTQPDQPLAARGPVIDPAEAERREKLAGAMVKLMEKLLKNPADVRGWTLLGRSYASLEKYAKSADAYSRAYEQSGGDPEIGIDYAEALAFEARTVVPPKAIEVLKAVLVRAPREPKAHYYLALAKAQQGDGRGAMQGWIDLAALSPPDAPWMELVDQQIARAAEEFDLDPAAFKPTDGATQPSPQSRSPSESTVTPGPNSADVDAAAQMTGQQRKELIRTMVQRLADRLKENPDDKEGWLRLEKAYRVLGKTAKADDAAARAAKLP